jgi:hypothetical protein
VPIIGAQDDPEYAAILVRLAGGCEDKCFRGAVKGPPERLKMVRNAFKQASSKALLSGATSASGGGVAASSASGGGVAASSASGGAVPMEEEQCAPPAAHAAAGSGRDDSPNPGSKKQQKMTRFFP